MMIRNFLFHRVSAEADDLWPPMHPVLFEKVIQFLTGHFKVVLLEEFLRNPSSYGGKVPLATLSFDDGYKDNLSVAAPILLRHNCPASFYVVTDCINHSLPTWTYITDHFFQRSGENEFLLEKDFVPDSFRRINWNDPADGSQWSKKVKPWMKQLTNSQRIWVMEQLNSQASDHTIPRNMMMNWDDIRQLHHLGFYVGSHSHTHPMLASLAEEKEIREELELSARHIQLHLGHRPLTISYPIGSWDERVIKAAEETGYKYGLAVEQRFYDEIRDNTLIIPRVELYNESWWKTRLRISGLYQKVKKLVR